jgi:16S rRNA (cytidine1402-2'-O)-methyltransferase
LKSASSQIQPGLYIVATPIGNLGDITLRALETLKACDLIVCEDTRVTAKLLRHYGIRKPTLSYNDHNGDLRRPKILAALKSGKRVALVSDAGTPLVSDPGFKLARAALAEDLHVTALPGPSSVLAALVLSGLPTDRFYFTGFLPAKQEACKREIQTLAATPATLIIFESARRLEETLTLLQQGLGDREAAVVREISKIYEESRRDTLSHLAQHYHEQGPPKGEVVIVVGPPVKQEAVPFDIESRLAWLLKSHSVKEAAAILAEQTGKPRKEIYALAIKLSDNDDKH